VRPRRRGRKPIRVAASLSRRLLSDKESTRRLARDSHRSVETIRRRCRSACRRLVEADALPAMPTGDGPLVLIIDGLWLRFRRQVWVSYNMAVKPPGSPTAFFLDSVMLAGQECGGNWQRAMETIPPAVSSRIRALVADGFIGSKRIARRQGWVLQRCHRHLDAMLSGTPDCVRKLRGGAERQAIVDAVREARTTVDQERVAALQRELAARACNPDLSTRTRGVVRRFLLDIGQFRAYLDHPELDIPVTTNAIESRHSQLRERLSRIKIPAAVLLRIRAYTRMQPTIVCNGTKNPQNQ
jgi:hypothetical protein